MIQRPKAAQIFYLHSALSLETAVHFRTILSEK